MYKRRYEYGVSMTEIIWEIKIGVLKMDETFLLVYSM